LYNNSRFQQRDDPAVGPPPSVILSEIFLQYVEENYTAQMARNYQLLDYFRYVDDIVIIYGRNVTDIN
jgi:hypothetical protein